MTTKAIAPALVLAFSCMLSASCLRGTQEANVTVSPVASAPPASELSATEPMGEALQPMGHVSYPYGSKDFPFYPWVADDKEDEAGGWQRSIVTLPFDVTEDDLPVYPIDCPMMIGMPERSRKLGTITSSRASLWTAQVANDVAPLLCESRPAREWIGQQERFCNELRVNMKETLNNRHRGLGARVSKPYR